MNQCEGIVGIVFSGVYFYFHAIAIVVREFLMSWNKFASNFWGGVALFIFFRQNGARQSYLFEVSFYDYKKVQYTYNEIIWSIYTWPNNS